MAINFPSTPGDGEEYTDPNSGTWTYDSGTNSWTLTAGGSTSAFNFRGGHDFRSSTPPADPIESGDMWIHDAPNGTIDNVYTGISGQIANGQLVLWDGNSYVMISGTLPGYPNVGDGEGDTLDSRYLKLGANAGAQTVATNQPTTFNGRGEFGGGVKVTGGGAGSVVDGMAKQGDDLTLAVDSTPLLKISNQFGVVSNETKDTDTITSDYFNAGPSNTATITNLSGFRSAPTTNTGTVTVYRGFSATDSNTDFGTTSYGFYSNLDEGVNTNYNFYAAGDAPNFLKGDTYIGGNTTRNTRELWESTLTEEQLEQLAAGTLTVPANVSNPGDGSFVRQWWYDQQSAEDQALIDSGELEYPERYQAANFVDTFALGEDTIINLLSNGTAQFGDRLEVRGVGESTLRLTNTNGAANNKTILFKCEDSGSTLKVQAINDAGAGSGNTFTFERTGNLVDSFSANVDGNPWFSIDNTDKTIGTDDWSIAANGNATGITVTRASVITDEQQGTVETLLDIITDLRARVAALETAAGY